MTAQTAPESSSSTAPGWAWEFGPLVQILRERGWEVDALDLPSTGSTESMLHDAAAITAAIDRADGPVVLVAHSYGGVPVTEAAITPRSSASCTSRRSRSTPVRASSPRWAAPSPRCRHRRRSGDDGPQPRRARGPDRRGHAPRSSARGIRAARRSVPAAVAASFGDEVSRRVAGEARDVHPHRERRRRLARVPGVARRAQRREIIRIPHGHAPFQEDPAGFADLLERVAALSPVAN